MAKLNAAINKMTHLIIALIMLAGLLTLVQCKDGLKVARDDKLRVCFVEGRGTYKRAPKHCPTLESNSNIECVVGLDRLDCLRRIHKGTAHFGVFSSEDLVTARWAGFEVLVTNEMRFHNTHFEYELVAVVANDAHIHSAQELRGAKFCHPGHGLEQSHITDILANYLESTLVARECEEDMSLIESRIKASSQFFGPSCKAGPWVSDSNQDRMLKRKYRSLCELCYNRESCGSSDKFWGRRGPLYCLSEGYGDVAWARLDDVKIHFGYSGLSAESDPSAFSYLCPDGHLQPLSVQRPCIWVAKPWPAVAAAPQHADRIQTLLHKIDHNDEYSWQNALLSIMETYHVNITTLDRSIPINDYLDQAVGFQSAYSFPPCTPTRSIVFCTSSLIQHYKCTWLQEAASVYGIEPDIQCVRRDQISSCISSVKHSSADAVMVDQDQLVNAHEDGSLVPILFEYGASSEAKYITVAVVRADSEIHTIEDLKGKRACFPSYEGAAYLSVWETLQNMTAAGSMQDYFSSKSCTWDGVQNCAEKHRGDLGALRCLVDGSGDVAFTELGVFQNFTRGQINEPWVLQLSRVSLLCPYGRRPKHEQDPCYLHWTSRGSLMVNKALDTVRKNEIYNSMRAMDKLFGKLYKTATTPFTMYGPFDRQSNVMFKDTTEGLRSEIEMGRDRLPRLLKLGTVDQYLVAKALSLRSSATSWRSKSSPMGWLAIVGCHLLAMCSFYYVR